MPQPIRKPGMTYRAGPGLLRDRPKIAELIGIMAVEWGYIDNALVRVFERANADTFAVDQIALVVFDSLSALDFRIKLISKVLALRVDEAIQNEFKEIAKKLRKSSQERKRIIHGSWHISDDMPDDLALMDLQGNAHRYTERDFEHIAERAIEMRNIVHRFIIKVGNAPKRDPSS